MSIRAQSRLISVSVTAADRASVLRGLTNGMAVWIYRDGSIADFSESRPGATGCAPPGRPNLRSPRRLARSKPTKTTLSRSVPASA